MQCSMRSTRLSHVMYKSDNIKLNAALQFVVYRVYSVRPICLKSHRLRGARRARILINHQSSQQQHTQSINMDGYMIHHDLSWSDRKSCDPSNPYHVLVAIRGQFSQNRTSSRLIKAICISRFHYSSNGGGICGEA